MCLLWLGWFDRCQAALIRGLLVLAGRWAYAGFLLAGFLLAGFLLAGLPVARFPLAGVLLSRFPRRRMPAASRSQQSAVPRSRSLCFCTLPLGVRGRSSANSR